MRSRLISVGLRLRLAGAIGGVDQCFVALLSHVDVALTISEVDAGRREVVEALVIAVIVVVEKVGYATFKIGCQRPISDLQCLPKRSAHSGGGHSGARLSGDGSTVGDRGRGHRGCSRSKTSKLPGVR